MPRELIGATALTLLFLTGVILVLAVMLAAIWILAHRVAAPGTQVSLAFGFVRYVKKPESSSPLLTGRDENAAPSDAKEGPKLAQTDTVEAKPT